MTVSDIGAYCRQVEDHLTRVNGGHLVRIVGAGFELVRGWAVEGIPLSVVYHAIDGKAERHEAGRAKHPLRIEYCESDVRETYERWRRAVGLWSAPAAETPVENGDAQTASESTSRRASLTKQIDRAIERLSRAGGRMDLPDGLRDAIGSWLETLSVLRDEAKGARGTARDEIAARLPSIDELIKTGARESAAPALIEELRREAEQDLASFRLRLTGDAWQHAIDATIDRLLRDRFGVPSLV